MIKVLGEHFITFNLRNMAFLAIFFVGATEGSFEIVLELFFLTGSGFVSTFDHKKRLCLGVWQNTGCGGWQLIMSIDKDDNDLFMLTPTKMTSDNIVKEFQGVNIEAGSAINNPNQKLGVAYMVYKRVLNKSK